MSGWNTPPSPTRELQEKILLHLAIIRDSFLTPEELLAKDEALHWCVARMRANWYAARNLPPDGLLRAPTC